MGQGQDTGGTRLGRLIAEERHRHSLSRPDLAKLIRIAAAAEGEKDDRTSETSIKRWENGLVPRADHLRWLAGALKLPVERMVALARSETAVHPDLVGPAGSVDEDRLSFTLESGHVDRYAMDDLVGLLRHYVSHAQGFAPENLLPVVVTLRWCIGAMLTGSLAAATRRRLTILFAETSIVAGRLAFWRDDRGQAADFLATAAKLADEVNEPSLLALTLAFRADLYSGVPYLGTLPGNTNLALALFDQAVSLQAPDWPPLLRSWVYGCRAEEHASLKQALPADRDMEAAHRALAAAARPGGAGDYVVDIAVLDIAAAAAGLSGFEGAVAIALGRTREARESFEAGLREQSSVGRLSGLAAAHALEGDVEAACELLSRGLDEAIRRRLPTRLRRVEGVRLRYLTDASDHPAVVRFDEQFRQAVLAC